MKHFFFYLCICCTLIAVQAGAQVKTEEVLVNRLLISLQRGNDSLYSSLFPRFDTLMNLVTRHVPQSTEEEARLNRIRSNPEPLWQFDPNFNPAIFDDFNNVVRKGRDSGIHWNDLLLARFELQKMRLPKELIGFEKIATERLGGFIYVEDVLTRRMYMIAVADILMINGNWYGGHVVNIQEAANEEDFNRKLAIEEKYLKELMEKGPQYMDSINKAAKAKQKQKAAAGTEEEEEKKLKTTEVLDRKYYVGKFDGEINVELYIRALKGNCPEAACAWEALYKFGDMEYYVLLEVAKTPEGTFTFTEEDVGLMELTLMSDRFTGTWVSFKDKTEYEAILKEKPEIKSKKLFQFDSELEQLLNPDY